MKGIFICFHHDILRKTQQQFYISIRRNQTTSERKSYFSTCHFITWTTPPQQVSMATEVQYILCVRVLVVWAIVGKLHNWLMNERQEMRIEVNIFIQSLDLVQVTTGKSLLLQNYILNPYITKKLHDWKTQIRGHLTHIIPSTPKWSSGHFIFHRKYVSFE